MNRHERRRDARRARHASHEIPGRVRALRARAEADRGAIHCAIIAEWNITASVDFLYHKIRDPDARAQAVALLRSFYGGAVVDDDCLTGPCAHEHWHVAGSHPGRHGSPIQLDWEHDWENLEQVARTFGAPEEIIIAAAARRAPGPAVQHYIWQVPA